MKILLDLLILIIPYTRLE